jgi:hypothetical protein
MAIIYEKMEDNSIRATNTSVKSVNVESLNKKFEFLLMERERMLSRIDEQIDDIKYQLDEIQKLGVQVTAKKLEYEELKAAIATKGVVKEVITEEVL